MLAVSFLLFGVSVATHSFQQVIQEILESPVLCPVMTMEFLEGELDTRLAQLSSAYEAILLTVNAERDHLNEARRLRTSAERRLRESYLVVGRALHDLDCLERMSQVARDTSQREILEHAYHQHVSGVDDSIVIENILRLTEMRDYRGECHLPETSNDLEKTLRIFKEWSQNMYHDATLRHRSEFMEAVSIGHLTCLNVQFLRTSIRYILGNRLDLLTELRLSRRRIANNLIHNAEKARTGAPDAWIHQLGFKAERLLYRWPVERGIDSGFTDSFFAEVVAERIEELDRLVLQAPTYVDKKRVNSIRPKISDRMLASMSSLHATVRAILDEESLRAVGNSSSLRKYIEETLRVLYWPLARYAENPLPFDMLSDPMAQLSEPLDKLVALVDPSVDRSLVVEIRTRTEQHIVAAFEKMARERSAVGNL